MALALAAHSLALAASSLFFFSSAAISAPMLSSRRCLAVNTSLLACRRVWNCPKVCMCCMDAVRKERSIVESASSCCRSSSMPICSPSAVCCSSCLRCTTSSLSSSASLPLVFSATSSLDLMALVLAFVVEVLVMAGSAASRASKSSRNCFRVTRRELFSADTVSRRLFRVSSLADMPLIVAEKDLLICSLRSRSNFRSL
mmetsp:Transcript_5459/g.8081  ORF Transcript_5459/g.8081 Transcript_5459/m.8081 type:complete len:200 (-) Transcript_5459:630-1229(-)